MLTVKREAELRLAIEKAGILEIPRLKTFDNPARFSFVLSQRAEGSQLRWTESYPAVPERNKVTRSVARIVLDLIRIWSEGLSYISAVFQACLSLIIRDNRIYRDCIYHNSHQSQNKTSRKQQTAWSNNQRVP